MILDALTTGQKPTRFFRVPFWKYSVHLTFGNIVLDHSAIQERMANLYVPNFWCEDPLPRIINLPEFLRIFIWTIFYRWLWIETRTYRAAFSHNTKRVTIGPLFMAFRQPCERFQKDGVQRCRWKLCHCKFLKWEQTYESWLTGFLDECSREEITRLNGIPCKP